MADMLNDGLLQSNRFIVFDRQALKEQDLAATGRVSRETAAPIGAIEGADLLRKLLRAARLPKTHGFSFPQIRAMRFMSINSASGLSGSLGFPVGKHHVEVRKAGFK